MTAQGNLHTLLTSQDCYEVIDGRPVVELNLPDGKGAFTLTAMQANNAVVGPHGNCGRTSVRFLIEVKAEVCGGVDATRVAIRNGLLREINSLRDELKVAEDRVRKLIDDKMVKS